jgi:hypothetical protein
MYYVGMQVMRPGTKPNNSQTNVPNIWVVIWLETKWKPTGLPKFWQVLWATIQTITSCQFFGYALSLIMPYVVKASWGTSQTTPNKPVASHNACGDL